MSTHSTLQQWLDSDNGNCPVCQSPNVQESEPHREHFQCYTDCSCTDCNATWSAVFGISNCADLSDGNDKHIQLEDPDSKTKAK